MKRLFFWNVLALAAFVLPANLSAQEVIELVDSIWIDSVAVDYNDIPDCQDADAKLAHLGVKLLLNKGSDLMLEETSTLGDVFNNLEGVEVVWGIGKNDTPQNGKIAICVVGGFMNI
jgi:hypothetical protein